MKITEIINRYKRVFLPVFLLFVIGYETYQFIERQIIIEYRISGEERIRVEYQNPLSVIFIGESRYEGPDNSYGSRNYDIYTRIISFTELIYWLALVTGALYYFISRGSKTSLLLFCLVCRFWIAATTIGYQLFYFVWLSMHPDFKSFVFNPLGNALGIGEAILIVCIFKLVDSSGARPVPVEILTTRPLRWGRSSHFIIDRFVTLALGFNMFLSNYFFQRYSGYSIDTVVSEETWMNWGIVSFSGGMFMSFFFTEGIFNRTPGKILSGTKVTQDNGESVSWEQIFKRTITRLIPLEWLSFFGKKGWHDRFSHTTLVYIGKKSWLYRQTQLTAFVFRFYLFLSSWFLVCGLLQFADDESRRAGMLPLFLTAISFPVVMLLFTSWMASISNCAQNSVQGKFSEENAHFISALSCWIPLMNFYVPGMMLSRINDDFKEVIKDELKSEHLKLRATVLSRCFGFFYLLFALGAILYLSADARQDSYTGLCMMSVALCVWCIGVLMYTSAIKKIERNVTADNI
jgi:uncharacterized RDD family membrane protein YckC